MIRRDLLKAVLGSTLFFCGRIVRAGWLEPAPVNAIVSLFSHQQSAARIGKMYLETNPGENDVMEITEKVFVGWDERSYHVALTRRAAMREMLAAQCKRDFQTGKTFSIDGWVLSQTEARLFAVVHLAG